MSNAHSKPTIAVPVAEYDRALGWLDGIYTVLRDLEHEARLALDGGEPLDPARFVDYLRLSRQVLRSATEALSAGKREPRP